MRTRWTLVVGLLAALVWLGGLGTAAAQAPGGAPQPKLESTPAPPVEDMPLPEAAPANAPEPAPADSAAVIESAPSAEKIVTPAPAVWVEGRFVKEPDTWVKIEGRWVKPLIGPPRYVSATWERRIGLVRWVPAHWEGGAPPTVTTIQPAGSVVATAPGTVVQPTTTTVVPGTTYVSGYWRQGLLGNYRWVPARVVGY